MTVFSSDAGVCLEIRGAVATISVDRQHKRNSLRLATWQALATMIASAEAYRSVRVILVRGAGGHFGAGNDISEFGAVRGNPGAAEEFGAAMAAAIRSVEDASKPVIMAIEGMCYGASVALALAGDLRIAADNAVFAITPVKLGALYLQSDLHRLVAAIGVGKSKKLIYSAAPIDAAQALAMGLVDDVIEEKRFELELQRLVSDILDGSPFSISRTKEMLRGIGHGPAPLETSESLALFVEATQGDDFAEGTSAFLDGRRPQFH